MAKVEEDEANTSTAESWETSYVFSAFQFESNVK